MGETIVEVIGALVGIALLVLSGFFIYWTAKFLNTAPEYLERIAVALEKLAKK